MGVFFTIHGLWWWEGLTGGLCLEMFGCWSWLFTLITARSAILVLMSEYDLEIDNSCFPAEERRKELEFRRGGHGGGGKGCKRASVLICIYDHDLMRYVCKD